MNLAEEVYRDRRFGAGFRFFGDWAGLFLVVSLVLRVVEPLSLAFLMAWFVL